MRERNNFLSVEIERERERNNILCVKKLLIEWKKEL